MKSRTIGGRKYTLRTTAPSGSVTKRLDSLETLTKPPVSQSLKRMTDDEWVDLLRLYAGQGVFDGEPDFAQALAAYEEAIRKATDDPTQQYYPPAEFMPHASQFQRERAWRDARDYPEIDAAWLWLAAMFHRVVHEEPGVALAEWEKLRTWFLRESSSWKDYDVAEHLDEMSLESLRREVTEDDGKTTKTTRWIGVLRQLWASQYGQSSNSSV